MYAMLWHWKTEVCVKQRIELTVSFDDEAAREKV